MKLEGRKDIHFAVWSVLISMNENNKGRKTNTHIQKQTLEREKKLKTSFFGKRLSLKKQVFLTVPLPWPLKLTAYLLEETTCKE